MIKKIKYFLEDWGVPIISGIAGGVIGTLIARTLLGL